MDIKKFEVLLKKINTLKQNLDLESEEVSELELELLRNYIMELYESISDEDWKDVDKSKKKKKKKLKNKRQEELVAEEKVEDEDELEEEDIIQETIIVVPAQEQKVEQEEEVEDKKLEVDTNLDQEIQFSPDLLELFEGSSASELSEKLSSSPIKDLRRAIGINDKVFTINELFGGDKELYTRSMAEMNEMENFEGAKIYLLQNVAEKFDWAKKDNQKKAKRFIKIVQRRFA